MLNKLMGLATVGSTWAHLAVLNRFLSSVTVVILLSVVSALMCCVLFVGALFAVYLTLIHYGLDPYAAAIAVTSVIVVCTGILVGVTIVKARQLRDLSRGNAGYRDAFGLSRMGSIAEAFINGLTHGRAPRI